MKGITISALMALAFAYATLGGSAATHPPEVEICAVNQNDEDFDGEFYEGPIIVRAGTVFMDAGELRGTLSDPYGNRQPEENQSEEEKERRAMIDARHVDFKASSALATTAALILTKKNPCGQTGAQAVTSEKWGWTHSIIGANPDEYFQIYGLMRKGYVDVKSTDNERFAFIIANGQLNARVLRATSKAFNIDSWSVTKPDVSTDGIVRLAMADLALDTHKWEGKTVETSGYCLFVDPGEYRCVEGGGAARIDFRNLEPPAARQRIETDCGTITEASGDACRFTFRFVYDRFVEVPNGNGTITRGVIAKGDQGVIVGQ